MPLMLKTVVDAFLEKHADWRLTILRDWDKIMGPLHSKVCVEKISDDTVFLGVYDSAWMTELHLLSRLIIRNINNALKTPCITALRLRLTARKPIVKFTKPDVLAPTPKTVVLTEVQKQALGTIKDPQLQDALKQLLLRCTKL